MDPLPCARERGRQGKNGAAGDLRDKPMQHADLGLHRVSHSCCRIGRGLKKTAVLLPAWQQLIDYDPRHS